MAIRSPETKTETCLRSMTGYAQTVVHHDGFVLTVALRSVNHRSLDVHVNFPEQLQRLEPAARKEIQAFHPRGHLQMKVMLEREAGPAPALDEVLIGKYIELFRRMGERYGLPLETAVGAFAQLPGVMGVRESYFTAAAASPRLESVFLDALRETLRHWDAMRAAEGLVLERDFRDRSLRICGWVERMEQLRLETVPVAQKKLRERLQAWLGETTLDPGRLAQEAAMLAEHTDVSEEILRLRAHSAQFLAMLEGSPEIGKKLDFLLQESFRELNTLMAKTTGLGESGLPITEVALDIKAELEKLREQVQNVQ